MLGFVILTPTYALKLYEQCKTQAEACVVIEDYCRRWQRWVVSGLHSAQPQNNYSLPINRKTVLMHGINGSFTALNP